MKTLLGKQNGGDAGCKISQKCEFFFRYINIYIYIYIYIYYSQKDKITHSGGENTIDVRKFAGCEIF